MRKHVIAATLAVMAVMTSCGDRKGPVAPLADTFAEAHRTDNPQAAAEAREELPGLVASMSETLPGTPIEVDASALGDVEVTDARISRLAPMGGNPVVIFTITTSAPVEGYVRYSFLDSDGTLLYSTLGQAEPDGRLKPRLPISMRVNSDSVTVEQVRALRRFCKIRIERVSAAR